MACDNQEGEDDIGYVLTRGLTRASDARARTLTIDGPVHPHPEDLKIEIRQRLKGGKRLPDVIMLDHRFGAEDDDTPATLMSPAMGGFSYLAHEVTVWITTLFRRREERAPAIVIRSGAEQELGILDRYAFIRFGGSQVILKRMTAARQVELILDALDGKVWTPPSRLPGLALTKWQQALLPSFEAGHTIAESIDWLLEQDVHPLPANWERVRAGLSPTDQRKHKVETCRRSVEQARHYLNGDPRLEPYFHQVDPGWAGLPRGSVRVIALGCALAGEMFLRIGYQDLARRFE